MNKKLAKEKREQIERKKMNFIHTMNWTNFILGMITRDMWA